MTRSFAEFLEDVSNGATAEELSKALAELVDAVRDTEKKGTLTFTVSIEPLKNGGGALLITDQIKSSVPKHDRRKNVFFADQHGNLTRNDPRQPTFDDVQEAGSGDGNVVDITKKEKQA